MAYTTINKSTDYFNTKLWAGNGSSQALTGVGHQTDMAWIKSRTDTRKHNLYDVVRGVQKRIVPNDTPAEDTVPGVTAFGTDGFTVGSETDTNGGSRNFVGWSWKANGAGSANTDGSINSTVSVNTTAGFSIVKWTGNGGTASVGHGLGVKPNIIIKKNLGAATNWIFSTTIIDGSNDFFYLNSTNAKGDSGETAPTTSLINLYANSENNGNGNGMIAYCFVEKAGYSKFGTYVGNGSNDNGTFVYTGFKPAFVLVKRYNNTEQWQMTDAARDEAVTPNFARLNPDTTSAESANTTWARIDKFSNGFRLGGNDTVSNGSGDTYIYMAFGQSIVGSNNIPATAR